MRAEGFSSLIAIKKRGKDSERQRRCDKKGGWLQGCDGHVCQFLRVGAVLLKLAVVLNHAGLVTCGDAPVHPGCAVHHLPAMGDLFLAENVGNMDNHEVFFRLESKVRACDKCSPCPGHDVRRMNAFNE